MTREPITVKGRIVELLDEHGSYRARKSSVPTAIKRRGLGITRIGVQSIHQPLQSRIMYYCTALALTL